MKIDYTGYVRRIDFNFRAKYSYVETTIYKISDFKFVIYIENYYKEFALINNEFDYSIRFITTPVHLTNIKPTEYESTIDKISDDEILSDYEGFPLTIFDLTNLIECRNQGINVSSLTEDHSRKVIKIILSGKVEENIKKNILDQLQKIKILYLFEIEDDGDSIKDIKLSNEVFSIRSSTSLKSLNLPYLERDESLWFDNINDIYKGKLNKNDLFFYNANQSSCFIDFSVFENINIRNHLLLYDVIYCTLPLREKMGDFLNSQKITKDDLIGLIANGRIKIINTQPEIRLDYDFLREIYQQNENSIISRRAIAALCAIDVVSMNKNYIFNDPEIYKLVIPFAKFLSEGNDNNIPRILSYLMWPISAMRSSFYSLHTASTKVISNYGVNNIIIDGFDHFDKEFKEKLEFEFIMHSEPIHIAHALDSTYFPFISQSDKYTDHPYTLLMANLLNFYKCANFENINEYFNSLKIKYKGNPSIDIISIFECNEFIPIKEFENETESKVLRKNFSSLFHELNLLNENERRSRIKEYNKLIESKISKKNKRKTVLDLGKDTIGIWVPLFSTGIKMICWSSKKLKKKFPLIKDISDYIVDKLKSSIVKKRSISFLTKINRVAHLKKYYD